MSRKPTQSEKSRNRNNALSNQMARRNEMNQCPTCKRKGAVTRMKDKSESGRIIAHYGACRYCDYEYYRWAD